METTPNPNDQTFLVTLPSRSKEKEHGKQQLEPILNVREASNFLRLKKRTLDKMRWMVTGLSFRKHGGRIYYQVDELKEWSLASCQPRVPQNGDSQDWETREKRGMMIHFRYF